jgi:DNA repair protein RadA
MGFFDRFSKSILGKKDAIETATANRYSTLSLDSASTDEERVGSGTTSVAVAELPDNTKLFGSDFDKDLDEVFASLEKQVGFSDAPAEEMRADDQAIIEQLFADIAANYARPIKNFIFELKRGTATKDWVEICRPAMQGIMRSAEGMGMRLAAQRMMDFEAAMSLVHKSEQRTLSGELRALLLWCYEDLVKVMPQTFVIGEEEQQREGIIINSLLKQIPDVGLITIEKLYRAGLTTLDTLYLAKKDELAIATGISTELSEVICLKFRAYRLGLASNNRAVGELGQRSRLAKMVSELRLQHEAFVHASANEWSNPSLSSAKREFRQQRQSCVLWINVLLAEVGEVDLINELQKMSFERRIQRLEGYISSPSATA